MSSNLKLLFLAFSLASILIQIIVTSGTDYYNSPCGGCCDALIRSPFQIEVFISQVLKSHSCIPHRNDSQKGVLAPGCSSP